ncbi:hypothetical protein ACFL6Y_09680 [Elusimicrobiota bacterium]
MNKDFLAFSAYSWHFYSFFSKIRVMQFRASKNLTCNFKSGTSLKYVFILLHCLALVSVYANADIADDLKTLHLKMEGSGKPKIDPIQIADTVPDLSGVDIFAEVVDEDATLLEKAGIFEARTIREHMPWLGLVFSIRLDHNGEFLRYDNLGDAAAYTGNHVAAQAFRYAATRDREALFAMEESLRGMHALHQATGGQGLIARVLAPNDYIAQHHVKDGRKQWQPAAPPYQDWSWQGYLSHDQYVGYIFGIANAWPYIRDEALRKAIREDMRQIALHTMRNKMRIMGKQTFLDFRPNYYYQDLWPKPLRKIPVPPWTAANSMHGLHLMSTAIHLTSDPSFIRYYEDEMIIKQDLVFKLYDEPSFTKLAEKHGEGIAQKVITIYSGEDVKISPENVRSSYSAEQYHRALYDLCALEKDAAFQEIYREIFKNKHLEVADEKNTLWNFLYASQFPGDSKAIMDGIDSLRAFPTRRVYGRVDNAADPSKPKYRGINGSAFESGDFMKKPWSWFSPTPLPFEERGLRGSFAWTHNAYRMDGGSDSRQSSGTAFLLAYWLGRRHNFITPAD